MALFPPALYAQTPEKEVTQNAQVWMSVNSTMHLSEKWGMIADVHLRRTHYASDASFYFLRVGANYWVNPKFTLAGGYAHMWLAPTREGWTTYANENRVYQQAQMSTSSGKTGIVLRLRNEQRWIQKIAQDTLTGDIRFVDRIRFLTSFSFPISRKPGKLALVVADEFLVHMGEDIVYNFFDQNRIFLGIRHSLNKQWSYDLGYMNVYQQRLSGYQYDMNHTFRWFFYYNPDFRKQKQAPRTIIDSRE